MYECQLLSHALTAIFLEIGIFYICDGNKHIDLEF